MKQIFAKIFGALCILTSFLVPILVLIDTGFEISRGLNVKSVLGSFDSIAFMKANLMMAGLFSSFVVTMVFGYISYFLSGATGDRILGKLAMAGITILTFFAFVLIFARTIYMETLDALGYVANGLLIGVVGSVLLLGGMLLVVGVIAVLAAEAKSWARLVPFVVFVGCLVIPVSLLEFLKAIGDVSIFREFLSATYLHFALMGSFSWSLLGIAGVFGMPKKVETR